MLSNSRGSLLSAENLQTSDRNMTNRIHAQARRACFRTPTGFHDKAQGKRSAALGKRGSKSSTPTGLHKESHRRSINPFQGLARKASLTQGGAALALGFGMKPRWGKRPDPKSAAYQEHYTGREPDLNRPRRPSGRCSRERQVLTERAPVSARPICDLEDQRLMISNRRAGIAKEVGECCE